jgi:hypothetical protein
MIPRARSTGLSLFDKIAGSFYNDIKPRSKSKWSCSSWDGVKMLDRFPSDSLDAIPLYGCSSKLKKDGTCDEEIAVKLAPDADEAKWLKLLSEKFGDVNPRPSIHLLNWMTCDSTNVKAMVQKLGVDVTVFNVTHFFKQAKDVQIMVTEKAKTSLYGLLMERAKAKELDILTIRTCIAQVIGIFARIQNEIPTFRHNDAHWGNILVSKESLPTPVPVQLSVGELSVELLIPEKQPLLKLWDFGDAVGPGVDLDTGKISGVSIASCIQNSYDAKPKIRKSQFYSRALPRTDLYCPMFDVIYFLSRWDLFFESLGVKKEEIAGIKQLDDFLKRNVPTNLITDLGALELGNQAASVWHLKHSLKTPLMMLTDPFFDPLRPENQYRSRTSTI